MQNIKQDIEGKPVDWYSDIFDLVFPDVDHERVNKLWREQLKKSKEDKKKDRKKDDEDDDD